MNIKCINCENCKYCIQCKDLTDKVFNVRNVDLLAIYESGDLSEVIDTIYKSKIKYNEKEYIKNEFIKYLKDKGYIKEIIYE